MTSLLNLFRTPAPTPSTATRDLTGPALARAMAMVQQGQRDARQLNRVAWYEQYRAGK